MSGQPILLVEDDEDDVLLMRRALERCGVANPVVVARDGVEALDCLFGAGPRPAVRPAVVLLDLRLPRIDGFEVLRRLRADRRTRLQPVVLLTSSNEERDRADGYGLGANSYVRKPVDFNEFSAVVAQFGAYWLGINEPPPVPDPG
ncbi:MAG: response regulator [Elusimicrobia bacterium]|nr:response regulator [Elusimicrobiota bacterium]